MEKQLRTKCRNCSCNLIMAIVSVTIVMILAMGWRGGLVVFLSVPVTFALTMFSYYFLDYTLNRITLFALVFVTGIVVDDSIIIAENMHRHFKMKKLPFIQAAIRSIDEVGNPTILATFTVIAAVLRCLWFRMIGPIHEPDAHWSLHCCYLLPAGGPDHYTIPGLPASPL